MDEQTDRQIERYLEAVIVYADLSHGDEVIVIAELREHIHALLADQTNLSQTEIFPMLENEFGSPRELGRSIARSKGRFRTYLKKQRRKLPYGVAAAVVLGLLVRSAVAQPFYVSGHGVAPQIPYGSRVLVYKLTRTFVPGDIVAYRTDGGETLLGIVKGVPQQGLLVERHGWPDEERTTEQVVEMGRVVGKVVLNTR